MLLTTTATIQGREIVEYKGLVFGEVVSGGNVMRALRQIADCLNKR